MDLELALALAWWRHGSHGPCCVAHARAGVAGGLERAVRIKGNGGMPWIIKTTISMQNAILLGYTMVHS